MKLTTVVLLGGLLLSPSLINAKQSKAPASPDQSYTVAFDSAFAAVNKALVDYSHTDCTSPEFNDTTKTFVDSLKTFGSLVKNMPDSLDEETKYAFTEEAFGVLYISNGIIEIQNKCVDEHDGSDKTNKLKLNQGY